MKLTRRQLKRLIESVINENSSQYLKKIKMLVDFGEFNTAWQLGTTVMDDHPELYDYLVNMAKTMSGKLNWASNPDSTHYELLMDILPDINDDDQRKGVICFNLAEYTLKQGHIEHIDLAINLGKRNDPNPWAFYNSQIRWGNSKEVDMLQELQDIGYVTKDPGMDDLELRGDYYEINYQLMAEPINKAAELYIMAGEYDEASDLIEVYKHEEGFAELISDIESYYM